MKTSTSLPTSEHRSPFPWAGVGVVFLLSLALLWTVTGTLSLYALSHHTPLVCGRCNYLCNLDHSHFQATYRFLRGDPAAAWEWSVVIRRILYPLFAYPFMERLGYERGGLIANAVLWTLAFFTTARFLWRRWGREAALVGVLLLATYPGQAYWFGSPYAYAAIVPVVLFQFMAAMRLSEERSWTSAVGWPLLIGILCLAYDVLPFFLPCITLVMLVQRRFLQLPLSLLLLLLPSILSGLVLERVFDVPFSNENSSIMGNIISSYLSPDAFSAWIARLRDLPGLFWHIYLASNFTILPGVFLIALLYGILRRRMKLQLAEGSLLLAVFAVFVFNNMAPPYEGWQLRGEWIPRLYQPAFVVMIFYVARFVPALPELERKIGLAAIGVVALSQGLMIVSPYAGLRWADAYYYNFYRHSVIDAIPQNIEKYGVRPFGVCKGKRNKRTKASAREPLH